ncbi:unnamed protein product [Ceutorhynchus assimilis]|uniref:Uncharacterized protein n=1 Tax=Ceutorhynchus assimilis TaxID=467358 RepID=A0A9N9QM50_9CUCU|nr:unnamed protein product [Ceutorhynchus assimilis]
MFHIYLFATAGRQQLHYHISNINMRPKLPFIVTFVQLIGYSYGHFWKDYFGNIPQDAFQAGVDANNEAVYVGQALYKSGVYPVNIQSGKEVVIPYFGSKSADNFVHILCANDPENFQWIPTNKSHLHLLHTDNKIVRGGIEGGNWVYVGRVKYQSGTSIGKVLAGQIGDAVMYFVHNGKEIVTASYEVLTYNDIFSKIDLRFSA